METWSPANRTLDITVIAETLDEIVDKIGLVKHGDARIITYDPIPLHPLLVQYVKLPKNEIEGGLSVLQPLEESYIAMDFWTDVYYRLLLEKKIDKSVPEFVYGNIVLNSCKKFDPNVIIRVLERNFLAWKTKVKVFRYTGNPAD
ncbi:MAG: hypothetical protein DRH57_00225 [Candidatus Cloacimonadota bacterium]|nr:MAG: hypothetical protein DRH57_00225 [Candidatus Cloacimonadota bacterium]